MNLSLKGKNALVCGSSKGIGRAAAIELAELGANITLVARSADKLTEVSKNLRRETGQSHDFLVADFSDTEDLRKQVKALTLQKPIHILINNSGGPKGGSIVESDPEAFLAAFKQHLVCNHLLVQQVLPRMKEEGYGRVVNVISTSVKAPIPGLGVSNTIRGSVASWSKTMSNEIGEFGITVNNVLPGFTATGRLEEIINNKAEKQNKTAEEVASTMRSAVPLNRFAEPSEIGAVIAFLSSPAASYVTGTSIRVDGGRTKSI